MWARHAWAVVAGGSAVAYVERGWPFALFVAVYVGLVALMPFDVAP